MNNNNSGGSGSAAAAVTPSPGRWPRYRIGDLAGGIAAAMVVLPQAMAYGVALFALMDMSPASGALAGLIGAACLSLVSGLFGGTVALISSPTGPSLALLSGALLTLASHNLAGGQLFVALVAVTVFAGVIQIAVAVSGGGRLIKFMPYPVVVGFMTGAALLMIKSQLRPLFGEVADPAWDGWHWIPAVTAIATFAAMTVSQRLLAWMPTAISGLIAGTVVFHLLTGAGPPGVPAPWVVGELPDVGAGEATFSLSLLQGLPWWPVVSGALALAMLASLNTLLTSVIADLVTESRHDAKRELVAQGFGQMLAGALGGMGGSATTGATVVGAKTGARRWGGVTAGAAFLALVFFFGPAGNWLPISVLAGIIIHVAVGMIERDMFQWLRTGRTRTDALVAMLVMVITAAYDLVTAVGAGVVIAIVLFIRSEVQGSVVHHRTTGLERHSVRRRTEEEHLLLQAHGDRIVHYELRGNLFFATADGLFEELRPDLDRPAWVILHLGRVSQIDLTGMNILHQIATRLQSHGGELLLCEVHSELGLGADPNATLSALSQKARSPLAVRTFVGSDQALEYAEDALLTALGSPRAQPHERTMLADTDLCRDMRPDQVAALEGVVTNLSVDSGHRLFAAGDRGDHLYIVLRGEVELRLQTTRHHYKRFATCGPGTFFGEVSFLDPGSRTADAVVIAPTDLLVLSRDGLAHLEHDHPDAAVALLLMLARVQGEHLRRDAEEIQRMAHW